MQIVGEPGFPTADFKIALEASKSCKSHREVSSYLPLKDVPFEVVKPTKKED